MMKRINYIFKVLVFIYAAYIFSVKSHMTFINTAVFLIITAVEILREKTNSKKVSAALFVIICAACFWDKNFAVFLLCSAYDFLYEKMYAAFSILAAFEIYLCTYETGSTTLIFSSLICGLFGYSSGKFSEKELEYRNHFDDERRLRYELETTKARLVQSMKETEHLTQIEERNRIARNIHDSVGHSLSGILIQLQAAKKLYTRNAQKSGEILDVCIKNLMNAITALRDTVHNIKPLEDDANEESIKKIIKSFCFCKINYKSSGDFQTVPKDVIGTVKTNLGEALSNASKYSGADEIDINININDKYIRTFIKDNGKGCANIKEGLGISGIRERVRKLSGSLSVCGEDGFTIVFIIPLKKGSVIFENIDS